MREIWKYTVQQDESGHFITAPAHIEIIRMNHVDDGFYKGDFVWGVVTADKNGRTRRIDIDYEQSVQAESSGPNDILLAVAEKQEIELRRPCDGLFERNGHIYMACRGPIFPVPVKTRLHLFKTGVPLDIDHTSPKFAYVGYCRIWIVQELAIYGFLEQL